jgi:hypothetical protein
MDQLSLDFLRQSAEDYKRRARLLELRQTKGIEIALKNIE